MDDHNSSAAIDQSASNAATAPQHLGFDMSIDQKTLGQLLDRFSRVLRSTIADELARIEARRPPAVLPPSEPMTAAKSAAKATGGIEVSDAAKLKAADLRIAVLMGKVPDGGGLLIDTRTTARLLNVSSRTLYRLDQLQAVPSPVRIAGKLIRWRLAEILEWIDSNCPPRSSWTYPSDQQLQKSTGRRSR